MAIATAKIRTCIFWQTVLLATLAAFAVNAPSTFAAAAHLEPQGKLGVEQMAPAIDYTRGEFATTLMKSCSDPAAIAAMITKVTAWDPFPNASRQRPQVARADRERLG